jgi:Fe-S cluster assembly iron-binding protein IscA
MNYIEKPEKFDEVIDCDGIKVILDSKALLALVGTELDYVVTDTS